jgi:septal ring factor EnvC (AmiA/AmiB activator)
MHTQNQKTVESMKDQNAKLEKQIEQLEAAIQSTREATYQIRLWLVNLEYVEGLRSTRTRRAK